MNSKKSRDARTAIGAATAPGTVATRADRADASGADLSIEHRGQRYEALSWGAENGRKVLALHGWLDNAASFTAIAAFLKDLQIVAVDLPGHGKSPHRAGGNYHFIDYAFDVINVADGLGWNTFDLLGHSLGAGIATIVAGAFPDRVERMALIEGLGPLTAEPAAMPAAVRAYWRKSAALLEKSPPSYESFEEAAGARARGGAGLPEAAARLLSERGLQERDGRWFWRNDARLTLPSAQRLTERQVVAFLKAIVAPVLVVRASSGLPFDEQMMAARVAAVRRIEVARVDGGHHVHMEKNAPAVAGLVRSHLQPSRSG